MSRAAREPGDSGVAPGRTLVSPCSSLDASSLRNTAAWVFLYFLPLLRKANWFPQSPLRFPFNSVNNYWRRTYAIGNHLRGVGEGSWLDPWTQGRERKTWCVLWAYHGSVWHPTRYCFTFSYLNLSTAPAETVDNRGLKADRTWLLPQAALVSDCKTLL